MHVIRGRNVHQILPLGLRYLTECGIPRPSRVGDVLVAPGPVTTVFENPRERVLFWAERDASPWLHFFESLWILAGRNDLAFMSQFVKRFADYSDDGATLHGAYGHRLRHWFSNGNAHSNDQLQIAIDELRANPLSRRVVLQLWDAEEDLGRNGKDLPCNQQLFLNVGLGRRDERNRLHMMVTCRSHDIIWGAYGANAVHFSFIHEYLAGQLNLEVGNMTFVSMNYHAYRDVYEKVARGELALRAPSWDTCPYTTGDVKPYPLIDHPESWDEELRRFLDSSAIDRNKSWKNTFFRQVAGPMWRAHVRYKAGEAEAAMMEASLIGASDWRRAAEEWLQRRAAARLKAQGQEHPFGYNAAEE